MIREELDAIEARLALKEGTPQDYREFISNARSDIRTLIAEVERLTREHEALAKDVKENASGICEVCKYEHVLAKDIPCAGCAPHRREGHTSNWQWRGVQGDA